MKVKDWGPSIHAIATIYFLRTDEGGRSTPTFSGYRGQFHYNNHDWDAAYWFASDPVYPGEEIEAMITLLSPDLHRRRLHVGMPFEIREGRDVVARATITWLDDDLA